MRQNQVQNKINNLPASVHKVYDCIPLSEPWDIHKIREEYRRKYGFNLDSKSSLTYLRTLVDRGLAKEFPQKQFKRVECRPTLKQVETMAAKTSSITQQKTPMQKLVDFAESLRSLASDIEDVALEMEEMKDTGDDAAKKLGQLKELLSSVVN